LVKFEKILFPNGFSLSIIILFDFSLFEILPLFSPEGIVVVRGLG